jgi:microsomal epoxide hydrolase
MIQGTRPQSLAPALCDSPAGLAGWMVEKFYLWSDCDGDVESRFTKDELLTNITLYWATDTVGSSFLPYWADRLCQLSAGSSSASSRVGGAILQYQAVDRDAAWRAFRRAGGAGTAG